MSIFLKNTTQNELDLLYEISKQPHIKNHLNPKTLVQHKNEYDDDTNKFLSIFLDDNIAGYMIVIDEKDCIKLKRIVIDEKFLGIGKEVLLKFQKMYKKRVYLDVYFDNARAISLYEKIGYKLFKEGFEKGRKVLYYEKN